MIGPELTGKTALARALADHFNTVYVPEYARIYTVEKNAVHGSSWWPEEFVHMARTQSRFEAEAEWLTADVMICDTDAFAIWVWHRYYSAGPIEALRGVCDADSADLYLLTSNGTGGNREAYADHGSREGILEEYRAQLKATGRRYVEVGGSPGERLSRSIAAVEELMAP